MAITGQVIIGGVGLGAIVVDLKFDNGQKWHFGGVSAPVFGGSASVPVQSAVFPGFSHIDGPCGLAYVFGGTPVGGIAIRFFDLHGEIGHITALSLGIGEGAGGGGGAWKQE